MIMTEETNGANALPDEPSKAEPKPGLSRLTPTDIEHLQEYQLLEVIGEGAHGLVLKARYNNKDGFLAIKVIRNVFSSYHHARSVLREVQVMRHLTKFSQIQGVALPLVRLLDFKVAFFEGEALGSSDATAYIIMEYSEKTLEQLLDDESIEWTEATTLKILYQTLCALNFLHKAGLMHRDIKPSNILVDSDLQVKLCDFGLTRTTIDIPSFDAQSRKEIAEALKGQKAVRTKSGRRLSQHVVSRPFRPPEIILLEKQYGPPADVWSLGCVLHEMLARSSQYTPKSRRLFSGECCYPLSPPSQEGPADIFPMMLGVLGRQDGLDRSFLTSESSIRYTAACQSRLEKINFSLEFPKASQQVTKMLSKMLKFNPYFRYSAKRLLASSAFDPYRDCDLEVTPLRNIELQVDHEEAFDYDKFEPKLLRTSDLKKLLAQEVATPVSGGTSLL